MQFTIKDHTKEVIAKVMGQSELVLKVIGNKMVDYAQSESPVDTSNLKNSIAFDSDSKSARVGSNVVYAARQEFEEGYHHKVGKAHYLRDAVGNHTDEYKALIEAYLNSLT